MITDKLLMFSESQAVIAAGDILGLKSIDLGLTKGCRTIKPLDVFVQVDSSMTTGGGITFQVICADAETLDTPTVLVSSRAYTKAELLESLMIRLELPETIPKRYLGVQYVTTEETGPAWSAEALKAEHLLIVEAGTDSNEVWEATTGGTTSDTEPTWDPESSPITDGTVVWTYVREATPAGITLTAGLAEDIPTGAF